MTGEEILAEARRLEKEYLDSVSAKVQVDSSSEELKSQLLDMVAHMNAYFDFCRRHGLCPDHHPKCSHGRRAW